MDLIDKIDSEKRETGETAPNYTAGFEVALHEHVLEYPLAWKKPRTIFVNSMSDLFHDQIPEHFIGKIFEIMKQSYWHQFQILTKRSTRLKELVPILDWPENVWIGVSVENEATKFRIDDLRSVPASIRFLSLEPLLGPIPSLELSNIDWVIVGGESGPRARLMKEEWAIQIKEQCNEKKVPFFFKQWGGINKKKTGRILEDRTWDEMPRRLNAHQIRIEHNHALHSDSNSAALHCCR